MTGERAGMTYGEVRIAALSSKARNDRGMRLPSLLSQGQDYFASQ